MNLPLLELVLFFATPLVASALARREGFGWADPVLVCYAVGLLLANTPHEVDGDAAKQVAEAVVPLAIPLLLFQTDFQKWLASSRTTVIAFVISVVCALVSLTVMSLAFRGGHPDLPLTAGMLSGTWTGGTPNLVSVGAALDASQETFILTNAADVLVGGIYLLALLTFARPLLSRVMPELDTIEPFEQSAADDIPRKQQVVEGISTTVLAAVIVAGCAGVSLLLLGKLSEPWIMLGISTAGIAASFVRRVREATTSYHIGNYLILVFCVAIGALTDLSALAAGGGFFVAFTASALALTLVLHYSACALLRIDVDTSIITSVATVMGPALVVPVAKKLNSRAAFVSGITSGLVGFALGNYVGIGMASVIASLVS